MGKGGFVELVKQGAKLVAAELGITWDKDPSGEATSKAPPARAMEGFAEYPDDPEWRAIVLQYQGQPERLTRLTTLSRGLRRLGVTTAPALIKELVETIADAQGDAAFLAACKAFPVAIADGGFLRYLASSRQEPEAAGAAIELGRFLAGRGKELDDVDQLRHLLERLTDRAAVKRYEAALELLSEHRIQVDPLDHFVLALLEEDADWLRLAATELGRLGRTIDRLSLVKLRDWATDVTRLKRYFRAATAFSGSGLELDQIDELVQPYLDDDAKIAALALIGPRASQIWDGPLTSQRVVALMDDLGNPESVRYYLQAVSLLRDLKMSEGDVRLLAREFSMSREDVRWLEAFVSRSREEHVQADRPGVIRIRERCPDVVELYRYLRMSAMTGAFPAAVLGILDEMILDAAGSRDRTEALSDLLGRLSGSGAAATITAEHLEEAHRYLLGANPARTF